MVSFLGWLNVTLLGLIVLPYILNVLNRKILKTKNSNFKALTKFLKKIHKPLGISLALVALIHGYLALGSIRLHTGTILYISILLAVVAGGTFYKLKKKTFFVWNKRLAFISVLLLLLHILYPNALWYLFN